MAQCAAQDHLTSQPAQLSSAAEQQQSQQEKRKSSWMQLPPNRRMALYAGILKPKLRHLYDTYMCLLTGHVGPCHEPERAATLKSKFQDPDMQPAAEAVKKLLQDSDISFDQFLDALGGVNRVTPERLGQQLDGLRRVGLVPLLKDNMPMECDLVENWEKYIAVLKAADEKHESDL